MENQVKQLAAESRDYVIELRRYFRMYPELSGLEKKTQAKIMKELKGMGLEPEAAAGTGVMADIKGARPGKRIAVRADMDALPLPDETDQPYRSKIEGICHACGHDGHMAMALGAAAVLSRLKSRIAGDIRFLFQPSEERMPGGARGLIAAGALNGVDAIIGAHIWQDLHAGLMGIAEGPLMAAPSEFTIGIQGKGGHGSLPQEAVDPLYVGAQILMALKTIIGADLDCREQAVLSIGAFQGGEVFNVIPDTAFIKGSVRTFTSAVRDRIHQRMDQICQGICMAAGASCKLDFVSGLPPVINHPQVTAALREAGKRALGEEKVVTVPPVMLSEDFSCYQEVIPGAFFFIGSGAPEKGIAYSHHHPKFDIDEAALGYGVEILVHGVLNLLQV